MKLKKLLLLLILLTLFIPIGYIKASIENLDIYSPSVILIDSTSGKILYEKNANKKMFPASVTKIMTAILVLENCELSDTAVASYTAIMTVPARTFNC